MHILITDSGVGGLSVCAYAEKFLRIHGVEEPVRLTYVNAARENDFGYNSMGSRREKLEHFDRFLHIVADVYSPNLIYVACNTLSVLLADTLFMKNGSIPVRGIVETGVNRLLRDLKQSPQSIVAIFGTVTTIEEQTYANLLRYHGIDTSRIVSQACPALADTISEDRTGLMALEDIRKNVGEAIDRSKLPSPHHLTYLACTHYGYRKEYFLRAFEERGITTQILNPNEFVVEDLFASAIHNPNLACEVEVEFVTRYPIPETALETISLFLKDVSPKTVEAFTSFSYCPDLF